MRCLALLVVACNSSPKKPHDANDDDAAAAVEVGPVTFTLPKLAGDRPGMIAVAQVQHGWRLIPDGTAVSIPEIARRAGKGGVLVVAPETAQWASIAELAFALHRECWALAGPNGMASWQATCPRPALPSPDRDRAELALWIDPGNVAVAAGPPPATFTTVPHAQLAQDLARRGVFRTLTYAIADTTDVATIVADVAIIHAAGFTDAQWAPPAWLPLRFPNGNGTDPPMPPPPAPRQISVVVGAPIVKGRISTEEVARGVRARAGVFRACYQKELNRHPNIRGELAVSFTIDEIGTVAKVEASGSLTHESIVSCLKTNVMRLRFPAKGKTDVRVKITFAAD
jgi:hypothetical protein